VDSAAEPAGGESVQGLVSLRVRHENVGTMGFRSPGGTESVFGFPRLNFIRRFFANVFGDV